MTSDPLLEINALLEPIPGDFPAGEALPFEIRAQLEDMRVDRIGEDVPAEEEHHADWPGIIRLAQATLIESSKDLLVGARLAEAMVKQYGFAGLRDGLRLLRRLVAECWDRLSPPIEDGDLEVRSSPLTWLDSAHRGARFPRTLRMVPLVYGETGPFGWLDWRAIQDGQAAADRVEDFEKAIENTRYQEGQQLAEDIGEARTELASLLAALNEKMGSSAPGLAEVRAALEECDTLTQQILRKLPPPVEAVSKERGVVAHGVPRVPAASDTAARDGMYRQIEQSALHLKELEPQSPIPYLILRAVEMSRMPFPELMRALIRNNEAVAELSHHLGIKNGALGGQSSGESSGSASG